MKRHDPNNIQFTDEKNFTVDEKFNRQNNKVYARSPEDDVHAMFNALIIQQV